MERLNNIEIIGEWNIKSIPFSQGEEYLNDLNYIKFSDSGLLAEVNPFLFVDEACQLLANSVKLFSMGYFDCAFYSIRQSLEITVSGLYLFMNPTKMKDWRELKKGFEEKKMVKALEGQKDAFLEIRTLYEDFFVKIKTDKERMNKYVHKQGFKSLYYFYNRILTKMDVKVEALVREYDSILKDAITAAAIYRLAIDPYPLLMLDEDVIVRVPDIFAQSYTTSFIEKYFPQDYIDRYKKTQIYRDYYNHFISQPAQNHATYALIHYEIFERKDYNLLMEQKSLLSFYDKEAVDLFMVSEKIGRILIDGCLEYACETKLKSSGLTIGKLYYDEIFDGKEDYNVAYKGDFISKFLLNANVTYVIHNKSLSKEEIEKINKLCSSYSAIADELNKAFEEITKNLL